MQRPDPSEYAPAFAGYIALVPEPDILGALQSQGEETRALLTTIGEERASHRYAPGKWSIRELVGHLSDAERVFGYRAFAIARGEAASLPGFDENAYIASSGYDRWSLSDLVELLATLRRSNLLVLSALDDAAWSRVGKANHHPTTPRALAYCMVGHVRHHLKTLRERYLLA